MSMVTELLLTLLDCRVIYVSETSGGVSPWRGEIGKGCVVVLGSNQ